MRDAWEFASFVVTALALPFAIAFFVWEQRKERDNEEEAAYQLLSDAYNNFLKVVLDNADLRLRSNEPLEQPTPEQSERILVIYDMLISLFERAYIVAWSERMSEVEKRRWNSWDDFMREWCRRERYPYSCVEKMRSFSVIFCRLRSKSVAAWLPVNSQPRTNFQPVSSSKEQHHVRPHCYRRRCPHPHGRIPGRLCQPVRA